MFEKLLAAVPYNPSLVHELAFYSRRMKEESSVRRAGMVMLVLAFLIQFFAVISPPQPTVADSSNDLINGGISSLADAVNQCNANTQSYKLILAKYGITCADVAKTTTVSLTSTDFNKQLFSMGRIQQGPTIDRTGKPTSETPARFDDLGTFYFRYLWSWDSGASSTYTALKGTSSGLNRTFYILYNCANLVFVGVPLSVPPKPPAPTPLPPLPPTPGFTAVKGVRTGTTGGYYKSVSAKPGEVVGFQIDLANTGKTTLSNVRVQDVPPATLTAVSGSLAIDGVATTGKLLKDFNAGSLSPGQIKHVTFSAKVGTPSGSCETFTNSMNATADSLPTKTSQASVAVCKPSIPITPCTYNSALPADSPLCKPCDKSVSSADRLACLNLHKAAANLTQNLPDANNTTAQAGDKIRYTLSAQNVGKATISNFVFQENLSDVLDYATVTDLHGGSIDDQGLVVWPALDVAAGATITKLIDVTVKSPIPNTPQVQGTGRFDHVMTNVYNNAINIQLPGSPVTTVETTAEKLPNTGPGTSLAIATVIIVVAGYAYSRSRLLAVESTIAVQENTSGGL